MFYTNSNSHQMKVTGKVIAQCFQSAPSWSQRIANGVALRDGVYMGWMTPASAVFHIDVPKYKWSSISGSIHFIKNFLIYWHKTYFFKYLKHLKKTCQRLMNHTSIFEEPLWAQFIPSVVCFPLFHHVLPCIYWLLFLFHLGLAGYFSKFLRWMLCSLRFSCFPLWYTLRDKNARHSFSCIPQV